MNPTRHVRRLAAALAGAPLAFAVAAPVALARPGPPRAWQLGQPSLHPLPPGWYKHPPLPAAHLHQVVHLPVPVRTVVISGMPGWQIAADGFGSAACGFRALSRGRLVRRREAGAGGRRPVSRPAPHQRGGVTGWPVRPC
jgi:hypothetical protein